MELVVQEQNKHGNTKISQEQKEDILKISYRYTSSELAKMYNCSRSTILKIWMDNNYHKRKGVMYYINHSYFKIIDTPNKAYVLGFIASDGTLYKRDEKHEGLIQIKLQESDEQILKDILVDMDSTYPVKHVKNKDFNQVVISIISEDLYNQLIEIGIKPNKTWNLDLYDVLSHIPKKYHIDFIRGYFDGDGSITKLTKNKISKVGINFSCPYSFGLDLQKVLKDLYDIKSFIYIDNHREYTKKFCSLTINRTSNKYKFLKLMYYENCLCLKRKCNRAKQLINAIEMNVTNRSENIKAVNDFNFLVADNGNTDEIRNGGFGSSGK